ncbi:hypothetical protein SLEP1_g15147 [Rubroshorea leprosula]|uniref:Uncharacterized protein n=1 Tax=Rubroshorea leprosula TaxID=152421 RepID=A0AAV5ILF3_9ROSI|nr:hypothetical protein SLEP1_g15147 [Rubroshorea leprosula]
MPLDYGSMDSENSPSPSSLEKMVEGVRRDEVVGVGGDSVPITVLEVEGRKERGYDIDADIVEEVRQYKFELETRDSLGYLLESYEISSRVLIRPAGVEERACSAPRDHWMPVYAHYLAAGLRFPILELLVGLLLDYSIGLTQLVPNAMRRGGRKDKGWYYFTPRVGNMESRVLFTAGPSSIKGWKEKFFFVDDTEWERGDTELKWKNFFNIAGGVAIPKKPRKKSKTSTKQVDEGGVGKEVVPSTAAGVEEEEPELQLKRKSREERGAPQKKKKVGAEVRAPGKEKGLVPPLSFQSNLFKVKNMTGARRFINATFPEVDKRHTWDEVLRYYGASVVKHVLERELGEWSSLGIHGECEGALPLAKAAKEITLMKDAFVELKENVQMLVHNGMKEHISNFISSSSFDNIINLYRLPTAIIAFTDYRKKVKAKYPKVDITKITFGKQEEGVEESGDSMLSDFRPQIKLRWDHDADERAVFLPKFNFEFVAVEEEGEEVEEDKVEVGVEGTEVDESQPVPEVEIHPVPSDDEQPFVPNEQ